MSRKSVAIECSACAQLCVVTGENADTVQFCPFCGDGVLLAYDDVDDDELLRDDRDEDEDDDDDDRA